MKIGIDVSPLYTDHKIRGIGTYVKNLLAAFEKKKDPQFRIKRLNNNEEIFSQEYDLLHLPYFSPYFKTLPWPWKINKPIVVTIHDLIPIKYPNNYPPGIKAKSVWEIQKRLLNQTKFVITDSFASKYDIGKLTNYPLERIYVTYLAAGDKFQKLKTGDWEQRIRNKYNLPEEFCLYVGDVNWNKNIPGLVKACEKIRLPLVIVGKQAGSQDFDKDHPENQDLVWLQNKVINQQTNKSIMLLGYVPTADLVGIYNLASVYCQPSYDEGFGLPVVEAMACGCPVVSSNQGSLPEVVGKAGLLVDPDSDSLASGIKKVVSNRSLQKTLIKKGLERAETFSWKKTGCQTKEVYRLVGLQA